MFLQQEMFKRKEENIKITMRSSYNKKYVRKRNKKSNKCVEGITRHT
jgi:hypothetical protein